MATTSPAIPADINDLQSIVGTLSDMIEMASQAHNNCDIDSETECGGEQYGDGSADEHCRLRDAEATVKLLRLAASAPELLAALKALLESIENVNFGVHDDDGQTYDAIPWAQAEAAIAKAKGRERGD